jgi:uncharacterized RDD family membrane protein YckC
LLPLEPRRGPVPASFARVIDRCLARKKEARFQSYDELLAALEAAGPRPVIDAGALPRALAWAIDVSVFVIALMSSAALGIGLVPRVFVSFAMLLLWLSAGALAVRATPGLWMMRLVLARPNGDEVSPGAVIVRSVLQYLWVPFAGLALAALYNAWSGVAQSVLLAALTITAGFSLVGSIARLIGSARRTLVDRIAATRVLVFVR